MKLSQLEDYFASIDLPEKIQVNPCTFVNNVRKLVDSNIEYLKNNTGNKGFMPYYNQLIELKNVLESENTGKIQAEGFDSGANGVPVR